MSYRQDILRKLLVLINDIDVFSDYPDIDDGEKEKVIEAKRVVRQELADLAAGPAPNTAAKKKKSPFDSSRYKTHDGEKGSPEKWRDAAQVILNVNNENCLTTLGLSGRPESEVALKTAYRAAIRKCHPDLAGGSEDEAAKLNAAYELALKLFFTKPDASVPPGGAKRKDTGLRPQLLTPIDEEEAQKYIENDIWCAQEKMDGKHIIVKKQADTLNIANKQGLETTLPKAIETAIIDCFSGKAIVIDGEHIGMKFWLFDILEYEGIDLRQYSYRSRYEKLIELLPAPYRNILHVVKAHFGTDTKASFFATMKSEGYEGVVFKKSDAIFREGRPEEGGDMVKCKFWKTVSAVVDEQDTGKSSFISYVFDGDKRVYLGHCSALGKRMPLPGEVVEIRYLYAYKGGKLVQQVLLEVRDDVDPKECTVKQLKFKREE